MKKLLIIGLAVSTIAFVNCKKTTTESSIKSDQMAMNDVSGLDVDKELDAIMAVIKSETECFFSRDYECWKKNWVTEDHVALTWNEDDGTFEANIGWDAISKSTLKHFKEHPLGGVPSSHPIIKREDIKVKFYGNEAAYLTWKQYNSTKEKDKFHISRDVRVMEKQNGQWKIANVSAFWDYHNPVILTNDTAEN